MSKLHFRQFKTLIRDVSRRPKLKFDKTRFTRVYDLSYRGLLFHHTEMGLVLADATSATQELFVSTIDLLLQLEIKIDSLRLHLLELPEPSTLKKLTRVCRSRLRFLHLGKDPRRADCTKSVLKTFRRQGIYVSRCQIPLNCLAIRYPRLLDGISFLEIKANVLPRWFPKLPRSVGRVSLIVTSPCHSVGCLSKVPFLEHLILYNPPLFSKETRQTLAKELRSLRFLRILELTAHISPDDLLLDLARLPPPSLESVKLTHAFSPDVATLPQRPFTVQYFNEEAYHVLKLSRR